MEKSLIRKLNQINKDFYTQVAESFDQTRQQSWEGWEQVLPLISPLFSEEIEVLDIACGNGRFAQFLQKKHQNNFKYYGIDTSAELLKEAEKSLSESELFYKLSEFDLIENLLENKFSTYFSELKFSLVAIFGVMHHIPSQSLRKDFFHQLAEVTEPRGRVVISFWQFAGFERFIQKSISPETVGIDPQTLEKGDYFLGWKEEQTARYCHSFSDSEITDLINPDQWQVVSQFKADGKEGILNSYLVLERKEQ